MWRRERMMVDVISIQNKWDNNNNDNNNLINKQQIQPTTITQPPLQNRLFYPFQGLHDDPNNFYAGNEYNKYGDLTINKNKRKHSISNTDVKRHKPLQLEEEQQQQQLQLQQQEQQEQQEQCQYPIVKANYTFTSKPYDVMDNLMYYY